MTTLTVFFDSFQSILGVISGLFAVIVAIAAFAFMFIYRKNHIFVKNYYPKMKIYREQTLIKESIAPIERRFKKLLIEMKENEFIEITPRRHDINHPFISLLRINQCILSGNEKLVGFFYPNSKSMYLTIAKSIGENCDIRERLSKYLNKEACSLTEEEYKRYKSKDWWLMTEQENSNGETSYRIERTKLP